MADLDSRLTKLTEWKTNVEATTTKEALKSLLVEIRISFKSEQSMLKMLNVHGWRVALQHFAGILKQADQLDSKLNRLLTFAENNNVTVVDKEAKVADFQSKLAEAKNHFQLAVDEFKRLRELKSDNTSKIDYMPNANRAGPFSLDWDRQKYHKSIQNHMKEAKVKLREARDILQSLVKEIVPALKNKTTDEGEQVEITEQEVLDPTKVTEGVDIEEGETTVEIAEEATLEL